MRIGVLGTGAVGGLYGGLLHQAGHEVHFLARSDYKVLKINGLHIHSHKGDRHAFPLLLHASPDSMPLCDAVLVAWKTTSNEALSQVLPGICHEETAVVMLQNGLDPETQAAAILGSHRILAGLCFLCCRRESPGRIWHQDQGAITLAQFAEQGPGGRTPRLEAIGGVLKQSGESIHFAEDWRWARWRKLVWNMAFNGPTALTGLTTLALLDDPDGEALVSQLMKEVVTGARSCGQDLRENFPEQMMASTRNMVAYEPSMKLDYDAGRPLETDAIYGRPLAAIEAKGIAVPGIRFLHGLLTDQALRGHDQALRHHYSPRQLREGAAW